MLHAGCPSDAVLRLMAGGRDFAPQSGDCANRGGRRSGRWGLGPGGAFTPCGRAGGAVRESSRAVGPGGVAEPFEAAAASLLPVADDGGLTAGLESPVAGFGGFSNEQRFAKMWAVVLSDGRAAGDFVLSAGFRSRSSCSRSGLSISSRRSDFG